jgi:hypothetical protein
VSFNIPTGPPNVPSDAQAWAHVEGNRAPESQRTRYAQLHFDDPPRRRLSEMVRKLVRSGRNSKDRRR